jgi:plasmid stability protein
MASITIRGLEPPLMRRLRIRAARRGVSMEEEACQILRDAVEREPASAADLAAAIRALFEPLGGVELPLPSRDRVRKPPDFR